MDAHAYLDSQGLTPFSDERLHQAVFAGMDQSQREMYSELFGRYGNIGDKKSTMSFYRFVFSTALLNVPSPVFPAGTPLYNILDRHPEMLSYHRQLLPRVSAFCEGKKYILDCGCGDALMLCYLALEYPETAFTGIDRVPEAVSLAEQRVAANKAANVALLHGDCYALADDPSITHRYDAVLLNNVLDDEREAGTPFSEARFDTGRKLAALYRVLQPGGQLLAGLTPVPEYTPAFAETMHAGMHAAGFTVGEHSAFPYGSREFHMWILAV